MKMKLNWITTSLVGALFVFALISCDLVVPESVRVKSNPGLYLSLGSPFAGGEGGMSLSQYLSVDGLKKQLGGESQNIDILEWKDTTNQDVQAYRVRYPVADINIDLSEYVESMDVASNLADAQSGWIPSYYGSEIEIPLPLDSMSFAHDVTNVKISVTLKFAEPTDTTPPTADGDTTVPEGVTVTFKGDVFDNTESTEVEGNKWTSPNIAMFQPATDKISIAVTVPAATLPNVRWFSPELGFEWDSATISLEGGETTQKGEYELDFSGFGSFMGEGVSFKEITGYMYLQKPSGDDLDADATLTLTWKKPDGDEEVEVTSVEDDDAIAKLKKWKTEFTAPNETDKKIVLTDLFTYPLKFSYELELNEVTVKSNENKTGKISADMVILLPLEFTLEESLKSDLKGNDGTEYRELKLEALNMDSGGGGDLLGRTGDSNGDDMFKKMEKARILISKYQNKVIDGLAFGVVISDGNKQVIVPEEEVDGVNGVIELNADDLAYPFNPKFHLLVPEGDTLKIKDDEDSTIDFTIAVEATTDLDYQVKF